MEAIKKFLCLKTPRSQQNFLEKSKIRNENKFSTFKSFSQFSRQLKQYVKV